MVKVALHAREVDETVLTDLKALKDAVENIGLDQLKGTVVEFESAGSGVEIAVPHRLSTEPSGAIPLTAPGLVYYDPFGSGGTYRAWSKVNAYFCPQTAKGTKYKFLIV